MAAMIWAKQAGRRTPRPRPPRHPRACQPGHRPSTLMVAEPTPALPSSPPGLPCLARRAAGIRNRGEHDLEGQATAAPGTRRPVIAQDPLSPPAGDDQRVPAGQRRPRRGTARTKTESTTMDPERRLLACLRVSLEALAAQMV